MSYEELGRGLNRAENTDNNLVLQNIIYRQTHLPVKYGTAAMGKLPNE